MVKDILKRPLCLHVFWLALIFLLIAQQDRSSRHVTSSERAVAITDAELAAQAAAAAAESALRTDALPQDGHSAPAPLADEVDYKKMVGNAQLYYVGVYESSAAEYTQEEQRARMQECSEQRDMSNSNNGSYCHTYAYMTEKPNASNTVTVHIQTNRPVALVLTAYDSVTWVLRGNTDKITLVYLSGYHFSQLAQRLPERTAVYSSFHEGATCQYCRGGNIPYFYGYEISNELRSKLQQSFGAFTNFQGSYKATDVYIN